MGNGNNRNSVLGRRGSTPSKNFEEKSKTVSTGVKVDSTLNDVDNRSDGTPSGDSPPPFPKRQAEQGNGTEQPPWMVSQRVRRHIVGDDDNYITIEYLRNEFAKYCNEDLSLMMDEEEFRVTDLKHFQTICKSVWPKVSNKIFQRLFENMDFNQDKLVDEVEFAVVSGFLLNQKKDRDFIDIAFHMCDSDKSQGITKKDFATLLSIMLPFEIDWLLKIPAMRQDFRIRNQDILQAINFYEKVDSLVENQKILSLEDAGSIIRLYFQTPASKKDGLLKHLENEAEELIEHFNIASAGNEARFPLRVFDYSKNVNLESEAGINKEYLELLDQISTRTDPTISLSEAEEFRAKFFKPEGAGGIVCKGKLNYGKVARIIKCAKLGAEKKFDSSAFLETRSFIRDRLQYKIHDFRRFLVSTERVEFVEQLWNSLRKAHNEELDLEHFRHWAENYQDIFIFCETLQSKFKELFAKLK